MAHPNILIPLDPEIVRGMDAVMQNMIPLRILCPECRKIYTLFINDFDQGLHCLLGQACPHCKRFIKESDSPDDLLVDAKEIREALKNDSNDSD